MADHENAVFRDLVNNFALALRSRSLIDWATEFGRIQRTVSYDRGLFYRAVIESCNQELGDDNHFRDIALYWLLPREYYLATVISKYLSKNDLKHATEKICSLRSSEIQKIKGIYPSLFGRELEDDIETFTVPHGNAGVGEERLENTVRYLHEKVQETYKCPQLVIMDSIYDLNEEDLRIAVDRYSTEYRKPLVEDLTRAGYGHFEHGLLTQIRCAVNRPEFFAEKLYKAFGARRDPNIQGMIDADHHIDYETIVGVITTVAEGDLMMMKEEYLLKSGFTLEDDIYEAFADRQDCLHLILMILNSNAPN
ncbi:hypothetical protein TIFTF001_047856 [Ficus carica]|uniref:Uncharacterized protein n=1 Tax=Ficus carica TaxID=3494 RepID=A0AA88CRT6_FICCA|nr:hypothetical protein TIFTF001_047850 [Ficus carica]GMN27009.1 hypothetical protein TIFTF001_047852 [Ficus carica]GMN27029.1 hypothetical protein TIFTF001_047854 [Ficus carica]GMN27043.1 hypothetical protein TIFTF001_047856 [Ficus carica]